MCSRRGASNHIRLHHITKAAAVHRVIEIGHLHASIRGPGLARGVRAQVLDIVVDAAIGTATVVKLDLAVLIEAVDHQAGRCVSEAGVLDADVDTGGSSCYDGDRQRSASGVAVDGKIRHDGLGDLAVDDEVVCWCGGCETERREEGGEDGEREDCAHNGGAVGRCNGNFQDMCDLEYTVGI